MTMPRAIGLMFFILFLGANAVEARVRCPAGSYYRVTQGACVSAQEFQWMLERVRKWHSIHRGNRTYVRKAPEPQTPTEMTTKTPTTTAAVVDSQPGMAPESHLLDVLPPIIALWERQYPTQSN
jgi:hypothetical protein